MTTKQIQNKLGKLGYGVAANKYPLTTQELIIKYKIKKDELKKACHETYESIAYQGFNGCSAFWVRRDDLGIDIVFTFDEDELATDNDYVNYEWMTDYLTRREIVEYALSSMRLAEGKEEEH